MKLGQFLPDVVNRDNKLVQANNMLANAIYDQGFNHYMHKAGGKQGMMSAVNQYGIEQLYFDWLRTAYAYRRMFIQDLYLLAYDVAEIRTPIFHLKNEIFRKGFDDWKPKFLFKCEYCGEEYKDKRVESCEKCGGSVRPPDPEQVKRFDQFKNKCNIWGQGLEEILKTMEDDMNIVDDAYLFLNKRYMNYNNQLLAQVDEIRRIHPALIEYDLDKNGLPENSHWLCPFHRDEAEIAPSICPDCGVEMLPTTYVWNHRGRRVYLFRDELIHISKFSPSETYGYSALLTIMQKVLTISGMDRFLYRYFFERKAPTGMILTYTDDPQSLEVERQRVEAKMMEDPTYMPWVAVSQRTGRGRTDFVRLFHTLHEMDYLPVRNEIRDRLSALYGVPQIYYNVTEGVGGLSGQTQQIKVFANVVNSDQRLYNEKIFPILLQEFGITDWELVLRTPEEKIESQQLQVVQSRITIAQQMQQLNYKVELKPGCETVDTVDFVFREKTQDEIYQEQMSQMGGGMDMLPSGGEWEMGQGDEMPGYEQHEGREKHPSENAHEGVDQRQGIEEGVYRDVEESTEETDLIEDRVYSNK